MREVQDKFSGVAKGYVQYRPDYPDELFEYILSYVRTRSHAWDAGTGNGQVAGVLSKHFRQVTATDISANQLGQAPRIDNVRYDVCRAEKTAIESSSTDLVTVAQAIHWFDLEGFSDEVLRVTHKDAVLAVWGYELLKVTPEIDKVIMRLYNGILEGYWSPHRRLIETKYSTIEFPFQRLPGNMFSINRPMDVEGLLGYLRTWSAVSKYNHEHSSDPVAEIEDDLRAAFGSGFRKTHTPVFLKMWQIT